MLIDVSQMTEGEAVEFYGECNVFSLSCKIPVSGKLSNFGGVAEVDISVIGDVCLQCARCLSPAFYHIDLLIHETLKPGELVDGIVFDSKQVDITQAVNDSVVADLPISVYCENCVK